MNKQLPTFLALTDETWPEDGAYWVRSVSARTHRPFPIMVCGSMADMPGTDIPLLKSDVGPGGADWGVWLIYPASILPPGEEHLF